MISIDICYTSYHVGTKTVAPIIPYFQGLKMCIQYLPTHPKKPSFTLLIHMKDKMSPGLHGVGIMLKTTQPKVV